MNYPEVDFVLICFSVVNPVSYSNVETKWNPEVNFYVPNPKVILVGLKTDLRNDKEVVERLKKIHESPSSFEKGVELAKNISALKYMECSSLTGEGVHNIIKECLFVHVSKEKKLKEKKNKKTCLLN